MKADIGNRADIEKLLLQFYGKVKADETIGFIFTDVAQINWEKHIPLITDFWETILLDNPVYTKNAMEVHFDLNKKIPLRKEHFNSWLQLFTETIDDMFEGKIAALAKTRAKSIGGIMLFKMENAKGASPQPFSKGEGTGPGNSQFQISIIKSKTKKTSLSSSEFPPPLGEIEGAKNNATKLDIKKI